jgi:hypothetical protein
MPHGALAAGAVKDPHRKHPPYNEPLDQPKAGVRQSRVTTHALTPVANIPSHEVGTCYSREHLSFPYCGTYSSIPSSQLRNAT